MKISVCYDVDYSKVKWIEFNLYRPHTKNPPIQKKRGIFCSSLPKLLRLRILFNRYTTAN